LAFIAGTTMGLTFAYHVLLQAVQAMTSGAAFAGLSLPDLIMISLLNGLIAAISVPVIRALDLRFGEPERLAW
jgi:hypothetical protein